MVELIEGALRMLYNPGDLVWANNTTFKIPRGEHAGVIIERERSFDAYSCGAAYAVDIQGCPPPPDGPWVFCTCCLRPRRDDYQQHEPVGVSKDLGVDFRRECEEAEELVS